ncbi:MAG: hypothetical protein U5L09_23105 [Bacteroidales bacterium]|nr:hypothetical protein [Bacteroidales bacterium]
MQTKKKIFLFPLLLMGAILFFTTGCEEDDTVLPNISGVTVSESESGGLEISWDAIENAESYSVYVAESESGPFELEELLSDYEIRNYYEYTDGTPGETYYFRVTWYDGDQKSSEEEAEIVSAVYPVSLLSDLTLETTTDLPDNNLFTDNSLEWSVNTDDEDYDAIDGFKIGFKREGRAEFSDIGTSFGDGIANWYTFTESDDDRLSRSGDTYTFDVNLYATYDDDDGQSWQSDDRTIDYKVIAVDENGDELKTISGSKKLELFDIIRKVEAERDGDDVIVRFTGSTLATHFELEVDMHEGDWIWDDTGTNKLVLSKSDSYIEEIDEGDWDDEPDYKTPYMYQVTINDVPSQGNVFDQHTFTVTPGKSNSDSFNAGSNSDDCS